MRVPPLVAAFAYLAVTCVLLVACQPDRYADVKQRYPSFRVYPDTVYGPMSRWSPDGTRIVSTFTKGIGISDLDGSHQVLVTDAGDWPDWSPDGNKIVFRQEGRDTWDIWSVNVDGTGLKQLTQIGYAGPSKWSPDGKHIAFLHKPYQKEETGIYLMDPDGTTLVQLTHYPIVAGLFFEWSPDSSHIAFSASDMSPRGIERVTPTYAEQAERLYVIRADGSDLHLLLNNLVEINFPAWSPDGQYLFFVGYPVGSYLVKAHGSDLRHVLEDLFCGEAAWSRKNNRLVCFCETNPGIGNLCSVDMGEVLSK